MPVVAVALGRQQAGPLGVGHLAAEQEDVGLLAGLEHPELVVDRAELGDQPVRVRRGAALGGLRLVPGGPAVGAGRDLVGGVVVVDGQAGDPGPARLVVPLREGVLDLAIVVVEAAVPA